MKNMKSALGMFLAIGLTPTVLATQIELPQAIKDRGLAYTEAQLVYREKQSAKDSADDLVFNSQYKIRDAGFKISRLEKLKNDERKDFEREGRLSGRSLTDADRANFSELQASRQADIEAAQGELLALQDSITAASTNSQVLKDAEKVAKTDRDRKKKIFKENVEAYMSESCIEKGRGFFSRIGHGLSIAGRFLVNPIADRTVRNNNEEDQHEFEKILKKTDCRGELTAGAVAVPTTGEFTPGSSDTAALSSRTTSESVVVPAAPLTQEYFDGSGLVMGGL